jgi:hypothetical protein
MTKLRRRCLVALVALAGAVTTSVAVPAAAVGSAAVQTAWARYDFHSARSGFLVISGRVDPAPGAFFAEVTELDARSTQPRAPFADVLDLDSFSELGTYGAVGNRDLCPGPVTCIAQNGGLGFSISFDVSGDGRHMQDIREYFVVRGAHVVIHDRLLKRWTASHRAGGVTRRTVADASGAGAVALGQTVGANLGVTAPGPTGGSIAIAVPGCDQIGAGALILSGGLTGETTICPTDNVAAIARKATTWDATGAVAGWSNNTTRLVVLRA